MLKQFVLLAIVVVAVATESCLVGDWGPWTDWSKPGCMGPPETSYLADTPTQPSKGHQARKYMMEHKDQLYKQLVQKRLENPQTESQSVGATPCLNGYAAEYPCYKIDMVAFIDFQDLCGNDCGQPVNQMVSCDSWGWTDPLDNAEYAIHTMNAGTSFVRLNSDITVMPTVVAYMAGLGTFVREWRDAKVIGNFVYIGSETYDHGLQVFDLTRLRTLTDFTEVTPDATYRGFGNSHNIVASPSSDTIFAVGCTMNAGLYTTCDGGLHGVNVADPFNPTFAGCFSADGYTHDAQCVVYHGPDTAFQGREICFNFNEDSLTIVDVTDKAAMVQLSRTEYTNNQYTHQGWLTEDHAMLLMDDELDEYYGAPGTIEEIQRTHIWHVTSLEVPVLAATWMSENTVIDHNQYIIGNMVYQSNYEVGLRMLVLNQTKPSLTEVAYFDVHPTEQNDVDFFGMWNAYPYFASNQMVCSVIETGLFILRPNQVAIQQSIANGEAFTERARERSIIDAKEISSCARLVEVEQLPIAPGKC